MKSMPLAVIPALFIASLLPAAAQEAKPTQDERLAQFLKQFPDSDANKDGVLTRDEVRDFNLKRRETQPGREQTPKSRPTHADVAYGEHEKQKFDLWVAEPKEAGKPTPLAIFIHGGGFRGGDKKSLKGPPDPFTNAGISYASINYRLSDTGPYPIMMEDAARCLQTIRHRAKEWNIDPEKIVCYGGSAGAGISLWLAFHEDLANPDSDDPIARQSTRILAAGTINGQSTYDMRTFREWFGVPDLVPHPALVTFYGVEAESDWETDRVKALMKDASAISHLTKDDVPAYLSYNGRNSPVNKDTDAGAWVHHVKLGLKLQEAMTELGLECHVKSADIPEEKYGSLEDFLVAKLTE